MGWNDPTEELEAKVQEIRQHLQSAQNILLAAHIRPDGDAIGSVIGFGLALEGAGKKVQMVLPTGVPAAFRHLAGSAHVRREPKQPVDMVIFLDCADQDRAGPVLKDLGQVDLNIDHHVTNTGYAKINLVDAQAAATTEILAHLLPRLGLPLNADIAAALMTGLITDTIGFRTTSMTPGVFRVAAALMEQGADLPELYAKALNSRSFEAARLWGAGLSTLEREERLVWTTLTLAERQQAGYTGQDDADLTNMLSSIEDADIVVIFVEKPNQQVKVSWRSKPEFDVASLAIQFGGGGHPAAAGVDIAGALDEVRPVVLQATRRLLDSPNSRSAGILRHHPSNIEQE